MVSFKQLGDNLVSKHTDEHYQQCIDFFKNSKDTFSSAANYIIVGNKSSCEMLGRVCHAGIAHAGNVPNVVLVGSHLALGRALEPPTYRPVDVNASQAMKVFANWLMNDSHFSHLIVNKPEHRTVEWLMDGGGFIVSAELPQPVLQMMMILSRTYTERSTIQFDKWFELVNKGLDPHVAYNITMCVYDVSLTYNAGLNSRLGHTTMYLLNQSCTNNFVKGELGDTFEKRPYSKHHSIFGCNLLFGGQNTAQDTHFIGELFDTCKEFCERLSKFRNGAAALEGYRPPNPFVKNFKSSVLRPKQVTYQELYEVVVPYIIEKGLFNP